MQYAETVLMGSKKMKPLQKKNLQQNNLCNFFVFECTWRHRKLWDLWGGWSSAEWSIPAYTVFMVKVNFVMAACDHWSISVMPGKAAGPRSKEYQWDVWKGWQQPQRDSNRAGLSLKCANGGLAFLVLLKCWGWGLRCLYIQLGNNPRKSRRRGKRESK